MKSAKPAPLPAFNPTAATLLADIKYGNKALRQIAIHQAPLVGTAAIAPLLGVCGGPNPAAARAAGEALRRIAHHAARPGAGEEARAAAIKLLDATDRKNARAARVGAVRLLGLVGGADSAVGLSALLNDPELRDEARMALQRIPGPTAEAALRAALSSAPSEFRPNVENALRHRRTKWKEVGTQGTRR